MAQTGLSVTISLRFLAYHKMSELNDGSRMAREANQDQRPAPKLMAAFKYNKLMAFSTIPNLYWHNSGLVLRISLEFLNSYSTVAAGLSKNSLNVQWLGWW
jgi:hypothetical protein